MAQQTAVEWLWHHCNVSITRPSDEILEQAKTMEKEQILNACYQFSDYPFNKEDHLEYYKETYSK